MFAPERARMGSIVVGALALTALTTCLFLYTVVIRAPWIGELSGSGHQWLTASTLKFSRSWYAEGPLDLRFAMLENPRSIELSTLEEREPYLSYPPGTILPIYALAILLGREPTVTLVMRYNLLNHLMIALLLGFTVLLFATGVLGAPVLEATLLAAIAPAIELLSPGPLYWHQNVFFSDQAVILPFVSAVFLEVALWTTRSRRLRSVLAVAQQAVLFLGCLTDWFFYSFCIVLFGSRVLFRRLDPRRMDVAAFWIAPALAGLSFLGQVVALGGTDFLWRRFLLRAGLGHDEHHVVSRFWELYVMTWLPEAYGRIGVVILATSAGVLAWAAIRGKSALQGSTERWILRFAMVIGLPCVLHTILLPQHAADHDFSVLKLSPFLSTVPLVLVPILLLQAAARARGSRWALQRAGWIGWTGAIVYLMMTHRSHATLFPEPDPGFRELGTFVHSNGRFEDVIFSPDVAIPANAPQAMSFAMKRVYPVASVTELEREIASLPPGAKPLLLFVDGPEKPWRARVGRLVAKSRRHELYEVAGTATKESAP